MSKKDFTLTANDMRLSGYCVKGSRQWAEAHGVTKEEFRDFIKNGWPASKFEAMNDGLADRLVAEARARREMLGESE